MSENLATRCGKPRCRWRTCYTCCTTSTTRAPSWTTWQARTRITSNFWAKYSKNRIQSIILSKMKTFYRHKDLLNNRPNCADKWQIVALICIIYGYFINWFYHKPHLDKPGKFISGIYCITEIVYNFRFSHNTKSVQRFESHFVRIRPPGCRRSWARLPSRPPPPQTSRTRTRWTRPSARTPSSTARGRPVLNQFPNNRNCELWFLIKESIH